MRGRRDEGRQEYDREMKDGGSAITRARYQEVASEFFFQSFAVVRGKTREGQSEMDGRRGRRRRSMLEGW